jgi:hypothetical protein
VSKNANRDIAELKETQNVLRAVGLLDDHDDLVAVLAPLIGDTVVGFYDPKTGELVVRGAALTPYVRITLAHELTHALDDQHFTLNRPALEDADDERAAAFSALVEGNALRVDHAYRDSLSDDERDDADAEEQRLAAGVDYSNIPRVLPALLSFPYAVGPALIEALLAAGGEARVNEAFKEPPVTTEQVMDPDAWLAGGASPVEVPPPKADGDVFDQGVLGMWGIVLVLEEEIGQEAAAEAAQGWGGDWYVAWNDGDETCVRNTFVMDTTEDLRELTSALDEWADAQDSAKVTGGDDDVTFTSCA